MTIIFVTPMLYFFFKLYYGIVISPTLVNFCLYVWVPRSQDFLVQEGSGKGGPPERLALSSPIDSARLSIQQGSILCIRCTALQVTVVTRLLNSLGNLTISSPVDLKGWCT